MPTTSGFYRSSACIPADLISLVSSFLCVSSPVPLIITFMSIFFESSIRFCWIFYFVWSTASFKNSRLALSALNFVWSPARSLLNWLQCAAPLLKWKPRYSSRYEMAVNLSVSFSSWKFKGISIDVSAAILGICIINFPLPLPKRLLVLAYLESTWKKDSFYFLTCDLSQGAPQGSRKGVIFQGKFDFHVNCQFIHS